MCIPWGEPGRGEWGGQQQTPPAAACMTFCSFLLGPPPRPGWAYPINSTPRGGRPVEHPLGTPERPPSGVRRLRAPPRPRKRSRPQTKSPPLRAAPTSWVYRRTQTRSPTQKRRRSPEQKNQSGPQTNCLQRSPPGNRGASGPARFTPDAHEGRSVLRWPGGRGRTPGVLGLHFGKSHVLSWRIVLGTRGARPRPRAAPPRCPYGREPPPISVLEF